MRGLKRERLLKLMRGDALPKNGPVERRYVAFHADVGRLTCTEYAQVTCGPAERRYVAFHAGKERWTCREYAQVSWCGCGGSRWQDEEDYLGRLQKAGDVGQVRNAWREPKQRLEMQGRYGTPGRRGAQAEAGDAGKARNAWKEPKERCRQGASSTGALVPAKGRRMSDDRVGSGVPK